jgi:hypothetical protein
LEVKKTMGSEGSVATSPARETEAEVLDRLRKQAADPFHRPVILDGLVTLPMHEAHGPARLANFLAAPAATQRRFLERIARATAAQHFSDAMAECEATDFYPSAESVARYAEVLGLKSARLRGVPMPEWDVRWRDRAYYDRMAEERGRKLDPGFDAEKDRLSAIPAEEYVERLTGEDVPRSGMVHCPLPGHDERTPSCHVRDVYWRCYGCQKRGSIYDLAGELWGLQRHGPDFMEIHRRLVEVFP